MNIGFGLLWLSFGFTETCWAPPSDKISQVNVEESLPEQHYKPNECLPSGSLSLKRTGDTLVHWV